MSQAIVEEKQEAGFRIDGRVYEIPTLDTLDLDEQEIFWDLTQMGVEDFVPPSIDEPDEVLAEYRAEMSRRVKNPRFLRALVHIAYRRGNRELPEAAIVAVVGSVNYSGVFVDFIAASRGDDAGPPVAESTSELDESSPRSSVDSNANGGTDTSSGSDEPDATPSPTGTGRSGTSRTSGPGIRGSDA